MQFYEKALASYNHYLTDPKKKDYFALVASLSLLIVLVIMIYPAVIHVSKLNKEVSDGNVLLAALVEKSNQLSTAEKNYNQIKKDLDLIDSAMPIGSDIKTYIKNPLETLAQKNNLTIKSLQFNDVPISIPGREEDLGLRRFEYSASFEGDFVAFVAFLKDLENYIRVTKVVGLDIKKSPNNTQLVTMKAETNFLGTPIDVIPNEVVPENP